MKQRQAFTKVMQDEDEDSHVDGERNRNPTEVISSVVDPKRHRFPHCLVWTPIPCLTWLFPFIGHMGIATSSGVVRDFAGSYYVSEDEMAFGWPTRYLQLDLNRVALGANGANLGSDSPATKNAAAAVWDLAVFESSEVYKQRVHNLLADNCHSHCALALEKMRYKNRSRWNMVQLAGWMFISGKYVGTSSVIKTWLPFLVILGIIVLVVSLGLSL